MPLAPKLPRFIDLHPTVKDTSKLPAYGTTNEDPSQFSDYLRSVKSTGIFARAGSICSAGEVPLFVLLPRCRRVFAIDQSLNELAVTFLKAAVLATLGADASKELFERDSYDAAREDLKKLHPLLPEPLQAYLVFNDKASNNTNFYQESLSNTWNFIRSEWHFADITRMRRAAKRVHQLTLIHGDLLELQKYGLFDVLYTSNAITYGRQIPTKEQMNMAAVAKMLKPGGVLLSTSGNCCSDHGLKMLARRFGFRGAWTQYMFQKPPQESISG